MVGKPLVFEDVYKAIKHAIMNGMFQPGHRIDSGRLQSLVRMSNTPVREALRRLSAEGLVEAHAREGFYIPYLTERGLAGLYDWLLNVTLFAAQIGAPTRSETHNEIDFDGLRSMPIVEATATFFLAVAVASGNDEAEAAIQRLNDRLFLIRTLEDALFPDRIEELDSLIQSWRHAPLAVFKDTLATYIRRRQAVVSKAVTLVARHVPGIRG